MVDEGQQPSTGQTNTFLPSSMPGSPEEFMGDAIAKVLFGDYNPGGRLAVTFPKSVGQIPFAFPFKPGSDSKGKVRETVCTLSFRIWFKLYNLRIFRLENI